VKTRCSTLTPSTDGRQPFQTDRRDPRTGDGDERAIGENAPMSVTRLAWLVTVLVALITGLLLLLSGYNGYAALGLAVAIAAAINLL
jgi:hypothetical protein